MTADELGNDHGLQCPKCKHGDNLAIQVPRWVRIMAEGCDDEGGDSEWDDNSLAMCGYCSWEGKVAELITIELDEGGE